MIHAAALHAAAVLASDKGFSNAGAARLNHGSAWAVFLIGAGIVGLLAGIGLAALLGNAIANPLIAMTEAMGRLASGDHATDIPSRQRHDEIGEMAAAVQVFKDNANRMEAMRHEQEEQKKRAEQDRKAALRKMADTFEGQVGGVVDAVTAAAVELQAS